MKKYLSCVILIILCIVCAMIFYVNANSLNPNKNDGSDSSIKDSTLDGDLTNDSQGENNSTDVIQVASIENEGTIVSEYLSSTNLRIEWSIYKLENEGTLYLSCEMYVDSASPLTDAVSGYLMINGEKKNFSVSKTVGTRALLTSVSKSYSFKDTNKIEIEGFLDVKISENNGVSLDGLSAKGTILASEAYKNMPSSYQINVNHISQYPDLPSGDEITSLAMVLSYLGYKVDKCELCDLYLDKGPVGFTDFNEANVGNPRNAYNSFGCLAPVIVNACNRFTKVNGGDYKAYNLSGYNFESLLLEVASGNPVIVWGCDDFDFTPSISRIWVVDGKNLYLKSNMATMVLTGYDLIKNTVTLSDPAGTVFEIDASIFEQRFLEMGAGAVVVKK